MLVTTYKKFSTQKILVPTSEMLVPKNIWIFDVQISMIDTNIINFNIKRKLFKELKFNKNKGIYNFFVNIKNTDWAAFKSSLFL